MTENDILDAIKKAYIRAGTQAALAKKAGMSQSTIADYLNGRYSIGNMTVSTLFKLFPQMDIDFFGEKGINQKELRRRQMLSIFDDLDEENQLAAIAMLAANFGENIRKETKR